MTTTHFFIYMLELFLVRGLTKAVSRKGLRKSKSSLCLQRGPGASFLQAGFTARMVYESPPGLMVLQRLQL